MKTKLTMVLSLAVMATVLIPLGAQALDLDGTTVDVSADAAFMSTYVWRGILLTDGPVLEPGVTIGSMGASLNIWGNMDLDDVNDNEMEFNELDFTLDYSFDVSEFSFSVGAIHYTFPNTDFDPTTEIYVAASSSYTLGAWLALYQDIDASEGLYASLGYDYSIPVVEDYGVDVGGAVSFGTSKNNEFYYGTDSGGLTDLLLTASVPFAIGDYVSIAPSVTVTTIINSDIKDVYDAADMDTSNVVAGISVSAAF